ncbi:hypothetical protein [Micromonospora tulbaghiae]|uniref:hypothetical protein n=1 Tax=Micromonospora tulbaghiae TaxID=479978 RepID=UPI0033E2899F
MSTVTMPADVAMLMAAGHLNQLHAADQNEGCCPVCCGPCAALKTLLDAGQLDDIARGYAAGGWDVWDTERDQVNRAFLARAWRRTGCHTASC